MKVKHSLTIRQREILRMMRNGHSLTWDELHQRFYIKSNIGKTEKVEATVINRLLHLDLIKRKDNEFELHGLGKEKETA